VITLLNNSQLPGVSFCWQGLVAKGLLQWQIEMHPLPTQIDDLDPGQQVLGSW
jgi:hypothetical protein